MKFPRLEHILPRATLICLGWALASCGSGLQGTYANDAKGIVLDIKARGQATLTTSLGVMQACTYQVVGEKLTLDCERDRFDFAIHSDGSLTAPFFGILRKPAK